MGERRGTVNGRLRAGVAESLENGAISEGLWREVEWVARQAVVQKAPAMQEDDMDEVLGRFAEAFARRWDRLKPDGHPYNYVRRWAVRCWIDHLRREGLPAKVRRAVLVDAAELERLCGFKVERGKKDWAEEG